MEVMFIVLCSDISLILRTHETYLNKTIHMISTGDPPLTCSCYTRSMMSCYVSKRSCQSAQRMPHCGTMCNDVARDIHCDVTMVNDVAMCT